MRAAAGNFGEARTLFSTSDATARTALDAILLRRDTVTAGLARGEGFAREVLVPVERDLRRAVPAEARL